MRPVRIGLFLASVAVVSPIAVAQNQLWITQFGTSGNDTAVGLVADGAGGVMIAGRTSGSLGGPNAGGYDIYLARHDSAGSQLWIRQFGTSSSERVEGLATDGAGGVMIVGTTGGDLGAPVPDPGPYIARYDGGGNRLWIRQFAASCPCTPKAVAPDGAGGAFVAGDTGNDVFVSRFDSAGTLLWTRMIGTVEMDLIHAATPDGQGGVVVGGRTRGSLGGPNAGPILNPTDDAFLARFDGAGNQRWISQLGTPVGDLIIAMASDGAGGVVAAGMTTGDLGAPHAGGEDTFLARYDSTGNQRWLRQFGTSAHDDPEGLIPDGAGGVVLAGLSEGSLGGPNAGGYDAILARYNGAGEEIWLHQFGGTEDDLGRDVAPNDSGGWMIAGRTDGSLGGPFMGGRGDVFLARYEDDYCYPDCEQSTGVGVLDVFDFLCFQSSFVNSEPYACDCDTTAGQFVCDIFDFLCFQNAFAAGCP